MHDDEVLRTVVRRPNCVSTATSASCGSGRRRADSAGQLVARAAERVVDLLEPELADVTRDRRLRDPAAGGGERLRQLELRPDPLARDDPGEQPLPLRLSEGLHAPSIDMQTFCDGGRRQDGAHARMERVDGNPFR